MVQRSQRAQAAPDARQPRLIDLRWGAEDAPRVTLVGKGVCFDTGGLDIKPAAGMLTMKKDMGDSDEVRSQDIVVMPQVKTPVIEPAAVGTFTDTVKVEIYCNTPESQIYWTDDGSIPTVKSNEYKHSITIDDTAREIKAIAVASGLADSELVTAGPYDIQPAAPVFEPNGGHFGPREHVIVTIFEESAGATVHYTVSHDPDEQPPDPTTDSPVYPGHFEFARAFTQIKAYATKRKLHDSPVVMSEEFWILPHAPKFSIDGGTFIGDVAVTISTATPDGLLRCTLDGSVPDLETPAHSSPQQIVIHKTGTVLNCLATAHKRAVSELSTSRSFRIKSFPPLFHPDGGPIEDHVHAKISTAAKGASIIKYHFTDSLHPDKSDMVTYRDGVTIDVTGTQLTAVAYEDGKLPSDPVVSKIFEVSCSPVDFYAAGTWMHGVNQTSRDQTLVNKVSSLPPSPPLQNPKRNAVARIYRFACIANLNVWI